jgi:alpha-tubulin suppressor-like RCC1 family protein
MIFLPKRLTLSRDGCGSHSTAWPSHRRWELCWLGATNSYGQTNVPVFSTNAIAIASGEHHSLALLANGFIAGWGDNGSLQTNAPNFISDVAAIAAGGDQVWHYCQITRLWLGVPMRSMAAGITNAVAIAAGANHALALTTDGTVIGCGNNYYGQASVPCFHHECHSDCRG